MASLAQSATPAPPARERILQTACELFYREGVRATGIDRIIAEAAVTKVTFYRCFPSKNELILAFLQRRHEYWMDWFVDALRRHGSERGKGLDAVTDALAEWFAQDDFRGCAFINSVAELGGSLPEVVEISRQHKQAMAAAIASLMPPSRRRKADAAALALAVDGAIIRAQFEAEPAAALKAITYLLRGLRR